MSIIKSNKPYFVKELGVKSIGLFGSYARGNQKVDSDIDVLIEMPANYDHLCIVWKLLEKETGLKIDLVRLGPHLTEPFLNDIQKEIIYA